MLDLKYLKRFLKVRSSLVCCGIPLERATRYVGIADVLTGMVFCSIMFLHLNEVALQKKNHVIEEQTFAFILEPLPHWLSVLILACHGVKFVMGIILYIGAIAKSRAVCILWLVVTSVPAVFAFPTNLLHLYEIVIVNQFAHEIYNESHGIVAETERKCSSKTTTEHLVLHHNGSDIYPIGENNNDLESRYIGFGNTTYSLRQVVPPVETNPIPSALLPETPRFLDSLSPLPRMARSRSPSLYQIDLSLVNENDEIEDDISEASSVIYSSRFYGLTPTMHPPLPVVTAPSYIGLPRVIVTDVARQEINHI